MKNKISRKEYNKKYFRSLAGFMATLRNNAKRKKRCMTLIKDEVKQLWGRPCIYCGKKIDRVALDRVTNKKGYSLDNVVPCCIVCNYMKKDYTIKQWRRNMQSALLGLKQLEKALKNPKKFNVLKKDIPALKAVKKGMLP